MMTAQLRLIIDSSSVPSLRCPLVRLPAAWQCYLGLHESDSSPELLKGPDVQLGMRQMIGNLASLRLAGNYCLFHRASVIRTNGRECCAYYTAERVRKFAVIIRTNVIAVNESLPVLDPTSTRCDIGLYLRHRSGGLQLAACITCIYWILRSRPTENTVLPTDIITLMFVTYIHFCQLSFSGTLLQLRDLNSISIGVMLQIHINLALSYRYESEKDLSRHPRKGLRATVTPSSSLPSEPWQSTGLWLETSPFVMSWHLLSRCDTLLQRCSRPHHTSVGLADWQGWQARNLGDLSGLMARCRE